jgi:spore coat protein H
MRAKGNITVLASVLGFCITSCAQQASPDSAAPGSQQAIEQLPVYELKMDHKDFNALQRNPFSNNTHPATFIANGETYENVKVRCRGEWARTWPKKPLKILFNDEKPFRGHHSLNLNSCWRDPAFVREHLAYEIYTVCGVPASQSRMVRLTLNGQFLGLYVDVEQPDKPLLRRSNLKGAALFKTTSDSNQADERDLGSEKSFAAHYRRETQKEEGLRELQSFCHDLARAKDVFEFFTERVDIDNYVNYLVASALTQNWDGFNKNHFLVCDIRNSKKWSVLPWDLDRTLGDHWGGSFDSTHLPILLGTRELPGTTGWNRLQDKFFKEPKLRARFLDRLSDVLEKEFTTEKLFPIINKLEAQISADAKLDRKRWPSPTPDLQSGIAELKSYISDRRTFLLRELEKLRRRS